MPSSTCRGEGACFQFADGLRGRRARVQAVRHLPSMLAAQGRVRALHVVGAVEDAARRFQPETTEAAADIAGRDAARAARRKRFTLKAFPALITPSFRPPAR
jgi:hypothetical protein